MRRMGWTFLLLSMIFVSWGSIVLARTDSWYEAIPYWMVAIVLLLIPFGCCYE